MTNYDFLIGKEITYNKKKSKIKSIEENPISTLIFRLEDGRLFGVIAFKSGLASTDDADVQKLVDNTLAEINANKDAEILSAIKKQQDRIDAQNNREKELARVKKQAVQDAIRDYREKDTMYFKLCRDAIIKHKGEDRLVREKEFAMDYAQAYFDEFSRLKDSKIASRSRLVSGTIENTYPGNVDELIAWLKTALTNITVTIGKGTITSDTKLVQEINDKRGTSYTPSYANNKQWSSWQAYLTDKEITDKMPKEVLEWKIDKNTGKTIDEVDLGPVYNKVENALSSNPVVLDLVLNYGFNLGKQR